MTHPVTTITAADVLANAIKILQDNPVFKYKDFRRKQLNYDSFQHISCQYVDEDNEGSCLFGRALIEAGVKPELFEELNLESEGIEHVLRVLGISYNTDQAYLMSVMQSKQDRNYAYIDVLRDSFKEYNEWKAEGN